MERLPDSTIASIEQLAMSDTEHIAILSAWQVQTFVQHLEYNLAFLGIPYERCDLACTKPDVPDITASNSLLYHDLYQDSLLVKQEWDVAIRKYATTLCTTFERWREERSKLIKSFRA